MFFESRGRKTTDVLGLLLYCFCFWLRECNHVELIMHYFNYDKKKKSDEKVLMLECRNLGKINGYFSDNFETSVFAPGCHGFC